jgi:hypothetical protein
MSSPAHSTATVVVDSQPLLIFLGSDPHPNTCQSMYASPIYRLSQLNFRALILTMLDQVWPSLTKFDPCSPCGAPHCRGSATAVRHQAGLLAQGCTARQLSSPHRSSRPREMGVPAARRATKECGA